MVHGDDQGLILPPRLAPHQVVIVPIFKNDAEKTTVMEGVRRVAATLGDAGIRVKVDERDGLSAGFRFNDWEMRGVPLRIEIGPRDVAKRSVALARRDRPGREGKSFVAEDGLAQNVTMALAEIHFALYERALAFRLANTHDPKDYGEFKQVMEIGWALSWWCGQNDCEATIKEATRATTRCIPFEQPGGEGRCIRCGQVAHEKAIFSKAY
jgi:prolyl-tRNA synthetase